MESAAFDTSLTEKPASATRLSLWRIFWNVFRALEICLGLLLVVWISARLPLTVRFFCHCLRSALSFAARPLVAFVVSNFIIGTVVAKSCRFSGQNSGQNDAFGEYYDELAKFNDNRQKSGLSWGDEAEEVVYQDKEVGTSALAPTRENHDESSTVSTYGFDSDSEPEHPKAYFRRTRSEKFLERRKRPEEEEELTGVLRRSETEKCRKIAISGGEFPEVLTPEEELSSEEFQRTVEAFIAKELRFRREESMAMAIVLQSN